MSEKKNIIWLHKQLDNWRERQLVSVSQADEIAKLYPVKEGTNIGRLVFSGIGALLIGLGIILFFAYNWQGMHRLLKLVIIFAVLILSNLGSIWFDSRNRSAGEGLSLLGTLIFGAAIWLISQIYHIDEHYPNAFLLWGLGTLAMAWARQSFLQCLAAVFLLGIWGYLEIVSFYQANHLAPWIVLIGVGALAWRLRSRWLCFLSLSLFYILFVAGMATDMNEHSIYLIPAISGLFISIGFYSEYLSKVGLPEGRWRLLREPFLIPGFLAYMIFVYALTFEIVGSEWGMVSPETALEQTFFWSSFLVSILAPCILIWRVIKLSQNAETDALHSSLFLFASLIIFCSSAGWVKLSPSANSILMNLIFVGHCILFIFHGSRIQRGWEVALGCLLFALLIFTRYIDLFESLLARSAAFLALGGCLFLVGNFYSRNKTEQQSHSGKVPS